MLIACPGHDYFTAHLALVFVASVLLAGGAVWFANRLGRRARQVDLRPVLASLAELDAREAEEAEYAEPMAALARAALPEWAILELIERVGDRESPSRRRYVEALRGATVPGTGRERLLEVARDAADPLAADVWSLLSGKPTSGWAKALVDSDGGADERRFMA